PARTWRRAVVRRLLRAPRAGTDRGRERGPGVQPTAVHDGARARARTLPLRPAGRSVPAERPVPDGAVRRWLRRALPGAPRGARRAAARHERAEGRRAGASRPSGPLLRDQLRRDGEASARRAAVVLDTRNVGGEADRVGAPAGLHADAVRVRAASVAAGGAPSKDLRRAGRPLRA